MQWNADGINTKKGELEEFLKRWKIDVAMIQESKLSGKSKDLVIDGYVKVTKDKVYGRSKKDVFGGGLITLVRRNLPFERVIGWKGKTTEGLSYRELDADQYISSIDKAHPGSGSKAGRYWEEI